LKACKQAEENRKHLVKQTLALAIERKLPADLTVQDIMASAERVPQNDDIYLKGLRRNRLGNPPGKGSTIGDEVNWESLLKHCPANTMLHVVSNDGDYKSVLNSSAIKEALADEWKEKNGGVVFLHTELGSFLNSLEPSIQLQTEKNKKKAIERFGNSGSFATTHAAVAEAMPYFDLFSAKDAEDMLKAAVANSQINWIASDQDVKSFLEKLIDAKGKELDPDIVKEVATLIAEDGSDPDEDIPF
jgi:hypothetical protein